MSTWAQLQTEAVRLIDEALGGQFSAADVLAFVKEAEVVIVREAELNITLVQSDLVASPDPYALPTDCLRIVRASILSQLYPLQQRNFHEMDEIYSGTDWTTLSGTPLYYILLSLTSLQLVPYPSAALTHGLNIWYVKTPAQTTASPVACPLDLQSYLPFYAKWKALKGDSPASLQVKQEAWADFMQGVILAKRRMRSKDIQQNRPGGILFDLAATQRQVYR